MSGKELKSKEPKLKTAKLTDTEALQLENINLKKQYLTFQENNIFNNIARRINVNPDKIQQINFVEKIITLI